MRRNPICCIVLAPGRKTPTSDDPLTYAHTIRPYITAGERASKSDAPVYSRTRKTSCSRRERERERLVRLVRLVRNRTTARRGCTARKVVLHLCGARLEVLSVFTSLCPRLTRKGRAGSSHAILRRPVEVRTGKYDWTLTSHQFMCVRASNRNLRVACFAGLSGPFRSSDATEPLSADVSRFR